MNASRSLSVKYLREASLSSQTSRAQNVHPMIFRTPRVPSNDTRLKLRCTLACRSEVSLDMKTSLNSLKPLTTIRRKLAISKRQAGRPTETRWYTFQKPRLPVAISLTESWEWQVLQKLTSGCQMIVVRLLSGVEDRTSTIAWCKRRRRRWSLHQQRLLVDPQQRPRSLTCLAWSPWRIVEDSEFLELN